MDHNALLEGSCHCGRVKLRLPSIPEQGTRCNCSLCRRLGTVWAYFPLRTVHIEGHPEHTQDYVQGDRTLRTIRCKGCGCVTHWELVDAAPGSRHGVNLNNFPPALLERIHIRRFDGAESWTFLD
ncbi:MAG: GFA family protein [Paucibacter sp.]|nr:GFA family protein [Roseateles sp.]